jgi:hypothetical protein
MKTGPTVSADEYLSAFSSASYITGALFMVLGIAADVTMQVRRHRKKTQTWDAAVQQELVTETVPDGAQ